MRRLASLLTGACLLAGCGSDDGGAAARDRGDHIGIVTEDVFAGDDTYRDTTLDQQAELGIGLIRQTFDWARIEPTPGEYDFSAYDAWLEAVAEKRMHVLALVFGAPPFASSAPGRKGGHGYPPRDPAALGRFAAALAERYGPDGTFWQEHPDLPDHPIRAWQIWNEPNLPQYWRPAPDAREYAALLSAASDALKRVDPGAEIVSAGLPNSAHGVPFKRYVTDLLSAGAADSFDTLGIHPYATGIEGVWKAVGAARSALGDHDSDAPIWITEIGWATAGPPSPFTVGFRGQAARVRQLLAELPDHSRRLRIRGLVYYNWRDSPPYPGGSDFWGLYTGLLTANRVEKPAFEEFRREASAVTTGGLG